MKKLILLTLLLIGNFSFSQTNSQEIINEQQRLEDLARSTYYQKGGKLLFYDIFDQQDRWEINENLTSNELRSKIQDLEQVKAKWEAPNGPLELALSRIDEFHDYNNKICSTYGAVKTPNSDHTMDWCKKRDDYKRQYPRKSGAYENAMGYWQKFYNYANQLLEKKNTNVESSNNTGDYNTNSTDTNSKNNNNSSNENSNSSSTQQTNNTNNSSNTETYSERLQRQETERKEHANKLAREHQEWANKQEADRIASEKLGEDIGNGIIAISDMLKRSPEQIARSKKRRARSRERRQASFAEYKKTYNSSVRAFGGVTMAKFDEIYGSNFGRYSEIKLKTGFHAGISAELLPLSRTLAFETAISFVSKGERSETIIPNVRESEEITNLYYIEIPILLKLSGKVGSNSSIYANIGPYFGIGLFGNITNKGISYTTNGSSTFNTSNEIKFGSEGINRIDYGYRLGIGVEINKISVGINLSNGLRKISEIGDAPKNVTYNLSLGYRIK